MFIEQTTKIHLHQRESKLGKVHNFKRKRTIYHFRCDCCEKQFVRDKSKVSPTRATNNFSDTNLSETILLDISKKLIDYVIEVESSYTQETNAARSLENDLYNKIQ